LRLC